MRRILSDEQKEKARQRTKKWRENNKEREKERCKNYAEHNKERLREYQKEWHKNHPGISNEIQKRWRQRNKEQIKEKNRAYRAREKELRAQPDHHIKRKARGKLRARIKRGTIVRPHRCDKCKKECVPQGHHLDYLNAFEVQWLCTECHGKEHRKKERI